MRRAGRLFEVVLLLQRRRAVTAREIAERLQVSERTIYRDIRELSLSGVPIEGEAGVGYRLRPGFDLPPLMFNAEELVALRLGARMVEAWADRKLAAAAKQALERIEVVLPKSLKDNPPRSALFSPGVFVPKERVAGLAELRQAVDEQRKLRFDYTRADGAPSTRIVHPLGLFYWGAKWTLCAWCELREDYREFRPDRMQALEILDETFETGPDRSLEDYLRKVGT